MNNIQLVEAAKQENGINLDIMARTYQGWQRLGYQVKKGEHNTFQTKIYFPIFKDKDKKIIKGYFMKTASFFLYNQVELIEDFDKELRYKNFIDEIVDTIKQLKDLEFDNPVISSHLLETYKEDLEEFKLDKDVIINLVYN